MSYSHRKVTRSTEPSPFKQGGNMHFTFKPMDEADARAIQAWRYEGPYSVYNWDDDDGGIPAMLDRRSPYYAVQDDKGELIGFFGFGASAQVLGSGDPHLSHQNHTITAALL